MSRDCPPAILTVRKRESGVAGVFSCLFSPWLAENGEEVGGLMWLRSG